MAGNGFSFSVKGSPLYGESVIEVTVTATGSFQSPVSSSDFSAMESAARNMRFDKRTGEWRTVKFRIELPADAELSWGDAQLVDARIFNGLVMLGRKGDESILTRFPPKPDEKT